MRGAVREAFRGFFAHDGFFLAAGLAFYFVICAVPFALLLVAGGGFLLSSESVVHEVVGQLTDILPVYQGEMEQILTAVAGARKVSGLLGTLILFVFATQLFAATRLVLNRIFASGGRGFFHGMAFDLGMIVLLTLLFFVSMGITATFAWAKAAVVTSEFGLLFASLFEWAGLFLAVSLSAAMFVLLYRFVPRRRIAWTSALTGSVAAALLWELAKQLFRFYIRGIGAYSAVYGPLAVTIALIMWVYYSAVVFVLGAELIRVLEQRRGEAAAV